MNVHVLQHVPFEGLGSIAAWLESRRARVGWTRFFADPTLPAPNDLDLLIVMGGPMGVYDSDAHPWLAAETAFLRQALDAGVAIVGICLGAQLLAAASGARVYPNAQKEIGWHPVRGVEAAPGVFPFPEAAEVFHWHGDTFDLPPGATHLARSAACPNQAFQLGRNVIGLQFHLETTPQSLDAIIDNCRPELIPGPYVQTEAAIRALAPERMPRTNQLMAGVLDYICRPA